MSGREAWRGEAAELFRSIALMLEGMADALDEDDGIMGTISGGGLADMFPRLPKHIRDVFVDLLSDDAASAVRADDAYLIAEAGQRPAKLEREASH